MYHLLVSVTPPSRLWARSTLPILLSPSPGETATILRAVRLSEAQVSRKGAYMCTDCSCNPEQTTSPGVRHPLVFLLPSTAAAALLCSSFAPCPLRQSELLRNVPKWNHVVFSWRTIPYGVIFLSYGEIWLSHCIINIPSKTEYMREKC